MQQLLRVYSSNHLQPLSVNTYSGKFTAEEREGIKALYAEGNISKREIARRYGVSHTCINDIINGNHPYRTGINTYEETARPLVQYLNELRDEYLVCEDPARRQELWHSVMALLPQSYNQRSTVTLNYEVARRMYHARRNHKLDEWHTLCHVFEQLPASDLITLEAPAHGQD